MLHRPSHKIGDHDVHIWHLRADRVADPEMLRPLLSQEESAQSNRWRQACDRTLFLLSRAMMRTVLASYLDCAGHEVRFTANQYGKPILLCSAAKSPLHFNLSHSRGAVALAVSRGREVGIDIEERARVVEFLQLAERFFSVDEARAPASNCCRLDQRREAFFAIWTLKESFVKGIGRGLSFPLDAFCFDLDIDRLVRFRPLDASVSPDWHFTQFELGDRHRGALAVQCPAGGEVMIEMRDWREAFLSD